MRKHTKRQIEGDGVKLLTDYLEYTIQDVVKQSEALLKINGKKNQRISEDCIKAIIKGEYDTPVPFMAGGIEKDKGNLVEFAILKE